MFGRLPVPLLSALAWTQLSMAAVPADPLITAAPTMRRQVNDAKFIGWFVESNLGITTALSCEVPGAKWYQDGKYGQCCEDKAGACNPPVACHQGSLYFTEPGSSSTITQACVDYFSDSSATMCATAFVFENMQAGNPLTNVLCGIAQSDISVYRRLPASMTESESSSEALPSQTATPVPEKKKGSSAWVAGVVVGPLVLIAIVVAVVLLLKRRKRNAAITKGEVKPDLPPQGVYAQPAGDYNPPGPYNQHPQTPMSPAPAYSAPYGPPVAVPNNAYGAEKYGHTQAYEMADSSVGSQTCELPADTVQKR